MQQAPFPDCDTSLRLAQVLLIHSDNTLRRTWHDAVKELPGVDCVREASDANQALHALATMKPDVAIVELNSPGISGIELTRQIIRRHPSVAVIICGRILQASLLSEAFRAGVRCCLQSCSTDDVIKAVTSLCRGETYFPETVRSILTNMFLEEYVSRLRHRAVGSRYSTLTTREREVLQRLITGRTSKEIARELDISVNTVDTHRGRIMQKLHVHSLTELTQYALLDSDE